MEAVTEKEERGADSVQRWTAKRRSALVLSILRGETSAQEAARKHGLPVAEIEGWQERYLGCDLTCTDPQHLGVRRQKS